MTCPHTTYVDADKIDDLCILCWKERCEKAESDIKHLTTSIEEGTLPYWQHKHDEMAVKWFKAEAIIIGQDKNRRFWEHEARLKAEAAAAEMRDCLFHFGVTEETVKTTSFESQSVDGFDFTEILEHALSSSCGQGWLSPDKARVLVEALSRMDCDCEDVRIGQELVRHHPDCNYRVAQEALAQLKEVQ